ncbi:hypothetical protein K8T06_14540 [bacterium]|nr:hypothetical protein [bacterium]
MLKTILDFILDEARLDSFFLILLFAAPLIGLLTGYITGRFTSQIQKQSIYGLLCGLFGSLISLMWWIYNIIMNYYGLDSVKGLLINLFIFIVLGCTLGLLIRHFQCKKKLNDS